MTEILGAATLPPELGRPQAEAYLGAMLLLGTGAAVGLGGAVAVVAAATRRTELARWSAATAAAIVVLYGLLVLGAAARSHDRTVPLGGEKHFCDLDCHLAYSVAGVVHPPAIGSPPVRAVGMFWIVRVRVRFDERTISPHRGNAPLEPSEVRLVVVDAEGHRFAPSPAAQAALDAGRGAGPSWRTPLRPGGSFTKDVVFDLPPGVRAPRLLIHEPAFPAPVLVFHENSLGHRKAYLALTR